jgi:hypothetical protein
LGAGIPGLKRPQLNADILECPYCQSDNVEPRQVGHFVNTLLLICFKCQRAANFVGPTIKEKPPSKAFFDV